MSRTVTKEVEIYTFDELEEGSQEYAISRLKKDADENIEAHIWDLGNEILEEIVDSEASCDGVADVNFDDGKWAVTFTNISSI